MTIVSEKCALSKMYTNHSIRVTGITVLTRLNFSSSEIMSVTGHKSVQTLANYQRTQDRQKIEMGKVLYQSMTNEEENIRRPIPAIEYAPSTSATTPKPAVQQKENVPEAQALVPFEAKFNRARSS